MATVVSEMQQLQEELAHARDRIELLEWQASCEFSPTQIHQIESACGIKRVTAEALASGACEYATSSDEELVAADVNDTMKSNTTAVTEVDDTATPTAVTAETEDTAAATAATKPKSKTQKRKELWRQELAQRKAAEAKKQRLKVPWVQRQTETQLLFAFTMTVIVIILTVVGIAYFALYTSGTVTHEGLSGK